MLPNSFSAEQPPGVVGVLKQVGGGLVDGHGSRAGRRIGRLAGVNGKGGKLLLLRFGHDGLLQVAVVVAFWLIWVRSSSALLEGGIGDRLQNKTARILFGPGPPGFKIGCV